MDVQEGGEHADDRGVSPTSGWQAHLPHDSRGWTLLLVRLGLIVVFILELYVTGHRQRPDLLDPTTLGSDPSNYYAAAVRLNDGHALYGPLVAGDLPVPGYPSQFPAPLLSPPLVGVAWRLPAALFGTTSTILFWLGAIALITIFTVCFALRGREPQLAGLAVILALGLPITLAAGAPYRYPGENSPLSFAALSGNLNAYLLALFVLVWWALSAGHERVAGTAGALATALKLGPIVLLWWLIVQRRWQAVVAFCAALMAFGLVGLVFAGLDANLAYARLALGGGIRPQGFAVADMVRALLHVDLAASAGAPFVVMAVAVVAIFLLRTRPRLAFAVAIGATIYSSPVVLAGNLALFLAAVAPWSVTALADGRVGLPWSLKRAPA